MEVTYPPKPLALGRCEKHRRGPGLRALDPRGVDRPVRDEREGRIQRDQYGTLSGSDAYSFQTLTASSWSNCVWLRMRPLAGVVNCS
jgi:hypothetical protein